MEKLIRGRRPVRSQLTRIVKDITTALAQEESDTRVIRVSCSLLEKTAAELEVWDKKVLEQLLEDGAGDDLVDKEFGSIEEYKRNYLSAKADIDELFSKTVPGTNTDQGGASVTGDFKKRKFHLPEVKLKTFGGKLQDWLGWWSQFEKIHLDEELHDTDKFQYLAQCMETGTEAKQLVDSYPQTESHYAEAVEALKERFGRQDLLLQVYVRELLTLVIGNVTSKDKLPLSQLYVELESHLRSLAELSLDKADPETWLFPLVESSLSDGTLRAWQRSAQCQIDGASLIPPKSRLKLLMDFIKSEVQCEQQISLAQQGFRSRSQTGTSTSAVRSFKGRDRPRASFTKNRQEYPTAAGLINLQTNSCGFCGKAHDTEKCFRAQKMTTEEKRKVIRDKRLCFQCLIPGHTRRNCNKLVKCDLCSGRHYSILCSGAGRDTTGLKREACSSHANQPFKISRTENTSHSDDSPIKTFHQGSNQCSKAVLMNTLKVKVADKDGKLFVVRLVGDNGSQRSYASWEVISKAGCQFLENEWLQNVLFGGSMTKPQKFPRYELTLYGFNGQSMTLELLGKQQLTGRISAVPSGPWLNELSRNGVTLTDVGDESSTGDILVGNDYWGAIRTGNMVKLSDGLVAEETVFGWTLGGPIPSYTSSTMISNMMICSQNVENLWKLEALGIRDPIEIKTEAQTEKEALAHFTTTVIRDTDGRYVVSLPWRSSEINLPSNRLIAEQRLKSTKWKLKASGRLNTYHEVFGMWEREGLIVKVNGSPVGGHYIPHRPVFKESKTTPVRPVFNASCRQGRNESLNDCLHKGPNLIELIPSMLLRFGEKCIGISADIRKAFQMLKVREEDQPFQRFLWWENEYCDKIVVYQHTRVVFGMTCSPFLLGATIHVLLDILEDKLLSAKLKASFYCDNLVSSVSTLDEYDHLKEVSTGILADAKMTLREWACTIVEAQKCESDVTKMGNEVYGGINMPVLGLLWNREKDTLSCVIKELGFGVVTKRHMLSVVAQVFDPMGFLSPAMLVPKLLVQQSWASRLGWDTHVPAVIEAKFLKWKRELMHLNLVHIPRFSQILNSTTREVHVFSDSSQNAMAAVAFLRTELNGDVAVQFLMAKSRLAPVKKPTIPRAELMSCVIGVRVAKCIRESLELDMNCFMFWSDSATALAWIKRNGDWGVFVKNRVNEILCNSSLEQWHHVPGQMNPADLPSRGCSPSALLKYKWWEGPDWLRGLKLEFPKSEPVVEERDVCTEMRKVVAAMTTTIYTAPTFSSYRKNVAVWGWILRFIDRIRGGSQTGKFLTIGEMRKAEKVVIKIIQAESFSHTCSEVGNMQIFKDSEEIFRVKTRLPNRTDSTEFIFPILLPKNHPLVDMLVAGIHRYHGHGGVQFLVSKLREKYWILQSRRVVRKVVRACVMCRRHNSQRLEVDPAALPSRRVNDAHPFSTTGVDLAGPVFLKNGSKAWIVLYTCALYRAVHLDIVTNLSTENFLRSLERFICFHGRPNTVYSDNGTNFVGAANLFKMLNWTEIEQHSGVKQIQWVFNPPTASWWGGFWERLVRSVKDLLKRMIGRSKLSHDELLTCLAGVSSTINERPLTLVTEDNEDLLPLTPAMFLRPPLLGHFPECESSNHLQKSYRRMKETQLRLQHRFRKEYLSQLVTRVGKKQQFSIQKDDVVLVGADNRKRYDWPLGRVIELLPGKDGNVRVVRVKTASGVLLRPLQRLYPLELPRESGLPVMKRFGLPLPSKSNPEILTRIGRVVKQPARYGKWSH